MIQEITFIDGKQLGKVVFLWLLIPGIISIPVILILFILGIEIEGIKGIWDISTKYLEAVFALFSIYITIRINVWIFNKISHKYGGIKYEIRKYE